jgi:hypothetical protein
LVLHFEAFDGHVFFCWFISVCHFSIDNVKGLNLLEGDGQGTTSTYDNGAFHGVEACGAHDICHAPRFVELLCIGVGGGSANHSHG